MGGRDYLEASDLADVREYRAELLLPHNVERYLRLVDYHSGARLGMEEYRVEHDHYLLLAGRQPGKLESSPAVHGHRDLPVLQDVQGLVDEEFVDEILVDHYGFRQDVVLLDVFGYGIGEILVIFPVIHQLVSGRGESVSRGDVGLESRVSDEIELRLQVFAPEFELPVGHLFPGAGIRGKLGMLARISDALVKLLGIGLEGGRQMAVLLLDYQPIRRYVGDVSYLGHLFGGDLRLELVLLHLDEQLPGIVLDYQVGAVRESYVQPVKGSFGKISHVALHSGINHAHDRAFPEPVLGMDECKSVAQIQRVIELVEQSADVERFYDHMTAAPSSCVYLLDAPGLLAIRLFQARRCGAMDTEAEFAAVRGDIAQGRLSEVPAKIRAIAEESGDPFTAVKCISLMAAIGDRSIMKELISIAERTSSDDETKLQVAMALRSLGFPSNAYGMLKGIGKTDRVLRASAESLSDMEEYESALSCLESISEPTVSDRCLMAGTLSSLGEHAAAISVSTKLIGEFPGDYGAGVAYVSSLISAGKQKEAIRYVRANLKEKTADSYALAAYAMWVAGNSKSAGAYASRAVNMDHAHIGAMETLGLSLAENGETDKARIVAGAINEIAPGNRAALNILSYCDLRS